jgi:hypothetical protein
MMPHRSPGHSEKESLCAPRAAKCNADLAELFQACLKRPTRVLIRNSPHSMPRMNPRGFAQAVLAFIAQQ